MLFADPLTKFLCDLIEKFLFENRRREKSRGVESGIKPSGEKRGAQTDAEVNVPFLSG